MEGIAAIIVSVGTLIGAVAAAVIAYRNSTAATAAREAAAVAAAAAELARQEAADAKREIVLTKSGVFEVGKAIDGRLTALLELTRTSALAEGRLQGSGAAPADAIGHASEAVSAAEDAIADAIVAEGTPEEGHL
jgi:type II secretory pathway component GspD/PulD (secretin)